MPPTKFTAKPPAAPAALGASPLAKLTLSERAGYYMRPDAIRWPGDGKPAASALPLAGGAGRIESIELLVREPVRPRDVRRLRTDVADLRAWADDQERPLRFGLNGVLERLSAPRAAFAGLADKKGATKRPLVMGIVNVTPDSFSDGGRHATSAAAIAHGAALIAAGADILDIGGELTRPGSDPVSEGEELKRVVPVVEGLAALAKEKGAALSIDTSKAAVMAAAVKAGATIINDVRALEADPRALETAAESGAWVVLMHCRGEPKTMQQAPHYDDVTLDVFDYLETRIKVCEAAGIPRARIAVDPGIGFGKTLEHNLALIRSLGLYQALGCPVLLGVSRKSFIGRVTGVEDAAERLAGSLAAAQMGLDAGADMLRVHDVAETVQAVAMWRALRGV